MSIENLMCDFCGKQLKTKRLYLKHLRDFHFDLIEGEKYVCDICDEKFMGLKGLVVHFSKKHQDINFVEYCEKRNIGNKCKNCGKMVVEEFCNVKCNAEYKRKQNILSNSEKYEIECKVCGDLFLNERNLSKHLSDKHKEITKEEYYKKYIMKEDDSDGHCLWCGKDLKFISITEGYQRFCYNTECNVLWYNKHTDRKEKALETLKELYKNSDDISPTQIGYWIKKGFTEEEAVEKVRERQTTNSVEAIMKRNNCSLEEAEKIRQEITDKWQATLNAKSDEEKEKINRSKMFVGRGYSYISQELFVAIYEKIRGKFNEIYFATLNNISKEIDNSCFEEFCVITKKGLRFLDFYIKDNNKCIEFDGDYWHGKIGNIERDLKRELDIKEVMDGIQILRIKESEYKNNKEETIKKCLDFLQE